MNSIRAYNMNLKELIHSEQNQNHAHNNGMVVSDTRKSQNTNNVVAQSKGASNENSVQVDIAPVWKQVSENIDLRNAAPSEVVDLSAGLFKAGAITFEDHINLSFQKDPLNDQKINVISYWQTEQENAIHRGAVHEDLNDIVRIQSILSYVDSLR
ncbi:MAG: hypothetical protein JKY84_00240 [Emcibacteraceae bacterium]|nr:hypothetical protein [Emcibacteraceae bacterium]